LAGSEITVGKVLIVPDLGGRNPFNFLRLRVKNLSRPPKKKVSVNKHFIPGGTNKLVRGVS